ncbi:MAG: hypothetical protein ACLPL5_13220 [Stellaceae bacterium]
MNWPRYCLLLLIATSLATLALYAAALAVDPYDTGRFAFIHRHGVPLYGQRMADASRGRDPQFDSAVIGNSTIQLLEPSRLDANLGGSFVNLAIPGTGPYEQLTVLGWFLRHHTGNVRTVIIGMDAAWCDTPRIFGPAGESYPFPAWLYARQPWSYLGHMFSYKSLEAGIRRLNVVLGHANAARPDGYNDYEAGKAYDPNAARARMINGGVENDQAEDAAPASAPPPGGDRPEFAALAAMLDGLPGSVYVALVFPPREASSLPQPGSQGASLVASCKSRAQDLAQSHPNIRVIDFLKDGAISQPGNFWDGIHYRGVVARQIEDAIAQAKPALR